MSGMMVDHKATLNRLASLIQKEKACAVEIYSEGSYVDDKRKILDIASQKTGEEFIVLIIGVFSSGKTSMINALIGEELLPTGSLPETAVLGELHYGSKKRITLYPKKGMWEGGDEPFDLREVTTDEIRKYVSLSTEDAINSMEKNIDGNKSQSRINAKFEKMVIYWPLDILKDGVVLVDSPGINDPYSNDYIVNDYLPKADAIVYVMTCNQAYTGKDKEQLEIINALGRKNILTGYTWYDQIKRAYRRDPEGLRIFHKTLINHMLLNHTELGEESIHFLDSMGGLDAKLDNDREALRRSGFEGFEDYLGQYLVEGKGTDQVKNMVSIITIQANAMAKDAERFNCAASQDTNEIKERIAEAEDRLKVARQDSFNTGRAYRNHLEEYLPETEKMVRAFIAERLPNLVDLEDFQPETSLPTGAGKLNPVEGRRKAKALQDECQKEILRRMNLEYKKWITNTLGDHLNNAVKESTEQIRPDLNRIAVDLTNITDTASGYKQSSESHIGNIALGVAFGFLTGDFLTGSLSAVYGPRTLARTAVFQFGTGVGLGLLMIAGAPITLPVVAISVIGASIGAILTGDNKGKAARIKVQAVRDFRDSFRDPKAKDNIDEMVAGVMTNVKEYINSACTAMETALAEDIENTANTIQQIIDSNNLSLAEKQKQIQHRNSAVEKLKELKSEASAIAKEYGIKEVVVPESGIKDIRVRAR